MRSSLALLAFAATAFASTQPALEDLKPTGGAPDGCKAVYDGTFEVTIFKSASKSKRDIIESRASCSGDGVLAMTLKDGVLRDAKNRIGYIASNYQFQFDNPPQVNSKYTRGFSACSNQSLALGSTTVFYQCLSGDFYNLYDRNWAKQCEPVEIVMMPCDGPRSGNTERKVVGSSIVATTVVTVVSAGVTKEVPTTIAVPMCQIGDGQVQVHTTPCDDMKLPIITAVPVSQIADGQIQVPTGQLPVLSELEKRPTETGAAGAKSTVLTEAKTNVLVVDTGSPSLPSTPKPQTMTTKKSFKSASATETKETASATETEVSQETGVKTDTTETPSAANASSRSIVITPSAIFALIIGITWTLAPI